MRRAKYAGDLGQARRDLFLRAGLDWQNQFEKLEQIRRCAHIRTAARKRMTGA
jgi:hypothetical protein